MITCIIISYIAPTTAYNEERLRSSTIHVLKWIKNDDDREIKDPASLSGYLDFTDESDLQIKTHHVEAIHQYFNKSSFRGMLEQDDHWEELDVFFDAMKDLEKRSESNLLNLKACHLLTLAVTKSLISLCIQHSSPELHSPLKTAKSAWITFIGGTLRRHLSFLHIEQ
ncbi:MAG: hypothetical protein K2W94_09220 [Alphaproteobacteria bacterium]|nr:hypothetical protein [Alphaproteobacteria bacterium]